MLLTDPDPDIEADAKDLHPVQPMIKWISDGILHAEVPTYPVGAPHVFKVGIAAERDGKPERAESPPMSTPGVVAGGKGSDAIERQHLLLVVVPGFNFKGWFLSVQV